MSTPASQRPANAAGAPSRVLPAWPFVALLGPFLVWWALGVSDFVWIPAAAVMAYYMLSRGRTRAPRGFGIWLLLMAWMTVSTLRVTAPGELLGGGYRLLLYYSFTVIFLYVYNARETLDVRRVTGVFTLWLLTLTIGGYLGIFWPAAELATPLSKLLPGGLTSQPLVHEMVFKSFSQFDDGYHQYEPRPSIPFPYTNNWGAAYSLALPAVVVNLLLNRGRRRFWSILALLPISAVPAFLTLNRGMFLGIGLTVAYVAVRMAMQRRFGAILGVMGASLVGFVIYQLLPVSDRLDNRLPEDGGNSTTTRLSLYEQAIGLVPGSPIFGYGAPQPPRNPFEAPVGTQGFIWMVLVSYGPMAVALFIAFFVVAVARVIRRRDAWAIAMSAILMVGLVEHVYYGLLPHGLAVMVPVAAMAFRQGRGSPPAPGAGTGGAVGQGAVQPIGRPSADSSAAL